MTIEQFAVVYLCVPGVESVTFAVKLYVPAALGVPETAPVAGFRVRPEGNLPPVMVKL